jgi:hypothetical protein
MYDESGTIENHLKSMIKKGIGMLSEAAKIGHPHNVGEMSTTVQLFLYEKVIVNSITHNLAGINYWRKGDIESLEKVQAKLLKIMLKLPESTPYWGLISELGIWPLEDIVNYKRLMLLQNLTTSDDSRLAKNLVDHQKQFNIEASWYVNIEIIGKNYAIQMENEELLENKAAWKKHIKEQINLKVAEKSKEMITSMTKLQHLKSQDFHIQPYIQQTNIWRIKDLIKVKLELLDIGKNHGTKRICCGCNLADESTEHILACNGAKQLVGGEVPANLNSMSNRKNLLQLYDFLTTYIERRNALFQENAADNNEGEASRS